MVDVLPTRPRVTPKEFFLWLGAMVSLYWAGIAFIFLAFNYINHAFPNVLLPQADPYQGGMPYEMASILVLVPLYALLITLIRRDIERDPSRKEVWIRRWALILTLFVTGATITGDVISLLTAFFRGEELTAAFLLKSLVVFLVASAGFLYIGADLRGYWDLHRKHLHWTRAALGLIALASIIGGFFIVGTPYQAREARMDNQRVDGLQTIVMQVVNYWQAKEKLPSSLDALSDPLSQNAVPVDPETAAPYEYSTSGPLTFKLCAVFSRAGRPTHAPNLYIYAYVLGPKMDSWEHAAGHVCFTRTIDPERYPPKRKSEQVSPPALPRTHP